MIQRKPSKIIESVVNSAHEEHFNVSKAIRDDAPITSMNSVIKSINFESDGDGAYILRKPLIKKSSISSNQIILSNKEDILTLASGSISITNTTTIILKFYDNLVVLHDGTSDNVYKYTTSMPVPWLQSIIKSYNTIDHTILTVEINHETFLWNVDFARNANGYNQEYNTVDSWKWMLVNDTWDVQQGFRHSNSIGNVLKRFVKVYPHESLANTYVFEIVTPEMNSITSGTDVGNANSLDINLLLENPYAIRDLYGYGYVSCTKILPYITVESDASYSSTTFNTNKIWELTEKGAFPVNNPQKGFQILVSANTNPNYFERKYILLKAFLTTVRTSSKYYCCWERSTNGGITWEECPEFLVKNPDYVEKIVLDLTMEEANKTLEGDDLVFSSSYKVKKKVVGLQLSESDFNFSNTIENRPDVLIIEKANIGYAYRFQIYIDTEQENSTPEEITYTETKSNFSTVSGDLTSDGKIIYVSAANDALTAPYVDNGGIVLEAGGTTTMIPYVGYEGEFYDLTSPNLGGTVTVQVNPNYTNVHLKSIEIEFDDSVTGITDPIVGSCLGIGDSIVTAPNRSSLIKRENTFGTFYGTWYNLNVELTYVQATHTAAYTATNTVELLVPVNNTKYVNVNTYDNDNKKIVLTNFSSLADRAAIKDFLGLDNNNFDMTLKIKSIKVVYTTAETFSKTYLTSTTGSYIIPYSTKIEVVDTAVLTERNRLFSGEFYFNENQSQLLVYKDKYVYVSGTNSAIMKLLNSLILPEEVTKVISWRGYLLLFSPKNIYLASYDINTDGYNLKVLSNTVGVPVKDADTIVPILNSVYFKSGNKIYKLVPNLYAASDDILNIHQISTGINRILEDILNTYEETHNFSYSDADTYMLFIPISTEGFTYCIVFDFNKQIWTLLTYPTVLLNIEKVSNIEVYLKDANTIYYFRENLHTLLVEGLEKYCDDDDDLDPSDFDIKMFDNAVPYADYKTTDPKGLITLVVESVTNNSFVETFKTAAVPIDFKIDFGQKSSNYTMDKQFLETKLILATLSSKDAFPISLDIYTDGISRELHWDANTDGAIWKTTLDDVGILNTNFGVAGQDYNGIFRQLIVKYSGRGKSIQHVISGKSKTLFKFYSMDVRSRILPKKH